MVLVICGKCSHAVKLLSSFSHDTLICSQIIKFELLYYSINLLHRPSGISQKKIGKMRGTYKKLRSIVWHYESIAWHFAFVITPNTCHIMKENMFNNN